MGASPKGGREATCVSLREGGELGLAEKVSTRTYVCIPPREMCKTPWLIVERSERREP